MKFIVDQMPEFESDCPFSQGDGYCKIDGCSCVGALHGAVICQGLITFDAYTKRGAIPEGIDPKLWEILEAYKKSRTGSCDVGESPRNPSAPLSDADCEVIESQVDFIFELCRATKGPDFTFAPSQVALLERCMKRLYEPYFNSWNEQTGECDQSKIPTMYDIYNLVCDQSGFDAFDLSTVLKEVITNLSLAIKKTENKS